MDADWHEPRFGGPARFSICHLMQTKSSTREALVVERSAFRLSVCIFTSATTLISRNTLNQIACHHAVLGRHVQMPWGPVSMLQVTRHQLKFAYQDYG